MAKANARTSRRPIVRSWSNDSEGDAELLAKHGVTEEELELLKTVSLFGNLSSARDIAFILKNIRGTKPSR